MIETERHIRLPHEAGVGRTRAVLAILAGKFAEVVVGPRLAQLDPFALCIHAAELPERTRNALLGGVFKLNESLLGPALPERVGAAAEGLEWRGQNGPRRGHREWRERSGG